MGWIGVQARVPLHGNSDFGDFEGKRERMQILAEDRGVAVGNGGDAVRGAGEGDGGGEASNDDGDVALESECVESFVDGSAGVGGAGWRAARNQDVAGLRGVAGGREFAMGCQRMVVVDYGYETVAEEGLGSNFRTAGGGAGDDPGFEVHGSVAEGGGFVFVAGLGEKAETDSRGVAMETGEEAGREVFREAVAGADRERAVEIVEVQRLGGA